MRNLVAIGVLVVAAMSMLTPPGSVASTASKIFEEDRASDCRWRTTGAKRFCATLDDECSGKAESTIAAQASSAAARFEGDGRASHAGGRPVSDAA